MELKIKIMVRRVFAGQKGAGMKKAILAVLYGISLALLMSAGVQADTNAVSEYFPLKTGNEWIYKSYVTREDGVEMSIPVTRRVKSSEKAGGKEVFTLEVESDRVENLYISGDKEGRFYEKIKYKGMTLVFKPAAYFIPARTVLGGAEVRRNGTVKMYNDKNELVDQGSYVVGITSEGRQNLEVPAGVFKDALKILVFLEITTSSQATEVTQEIYLAEGLGMIKVNRIDKVVSLPKNEQITLFYQRDELESAIIDGKEI
ncbi:MAG: hypothetical protein KA022_02950 [Candidatus Omnitrophica bacterium]|nr:hypothetical protein [Candidatus Omnitrophota bacterium]